MHGYKDCLLLAGAKVIDYKEFGSYQGDWIAVVEYKGQKGFVKDYYGSCSGCDPFEQEFDMDDHECVSGEIHNPLDAFNFRDDCGICQEEKIRVQNFGAEYLKEILSYDKMIEEASENLEWDDDAESMVRFVKKYESWFSGRIENE